MMCYRARSMFSAYLDGALTGHQMQALSEHLDNCAACGAEYARLRRTQQLLASMGPKQPPPELALKLRVALSREAARRPSRRLHRFFVQLQDALNAFMLPATAGVVSAIIFFGILIGVLALPGKLQASRDDVPTMFYTPPQLQALPTNMGLPGPSAGPVVVETYVDANGRVQDYRIISAPEDHQNLRPELDNIMIFTTFRPATSFGVPTSGRAVISFAKINVKG
jgi:hypothetical protein